MDRSSEDGQEKNRDGQTSPMPISEAACDRSESPTGGDTDMDRPPSCCSSRSPVSYDEYFLRCGDQCTL
jgi:hypothetical protein